MKTIEINLENTVDDKPYIPFKCGQCPLGFNTWDEYLNHYCEARQCKPTDPQYMGDNWQEISEAALQRGEERRGELIHPSEKANREE